MKVADAHILFVPDGREPSPDHWQWRWRQKLSTGRLAMRQGGNGADGWDETIVQAVNGADKPVVLVAHGHGIPAAIAALPRFEQRIAGAFLAAPVEPDGDAGAQLRSRLPFPAMLVASRNDPLCTYHAAERLAEDWGALLLDAGEAGHIDAESGYGPWPEGSMAFAQFLRKLS